VPTDEKDKEPENKKQQQQQQQQQGDSKMDKDHPEERDEFNENHDYGSRDNYQQR
jgi:hypothetical protein